MPYISDQLYLAKLTLDAHENLLQDPIEKAFQQRIATQGEQLPQGVLKVEYWTPRNLGDWFHVLRDKVIVTMEGIPNKRDFQAVALFNGLNLEDATDAMFEGLMQEGQVRYNLMRGYDDPVASVSKLPKMEDKYEVTIYRHRNSEIAIRILAQYLDLQLAQPTSFQLR